MQAHETAFAPDAVARNLLNPDEVMHLPNDTGIVSFHGLGIRPYQYRKIPYYQHKKLATQFLPNPFVANDHITLPAWFGRTKKVPIISEAAPASVSRLPQYQLGQLSYPKGFKPKLPKKR